MMQATGKSITESRIAILDFFAKRRNGRENDRIVHERALPTDTDTDGETHEDTDRKRWNR